jgi:hypothetical protein
LQPDFFFEQIVRRTKRKWNQPEFPVMPNRLSCFLQ